jgi:ATP-dependent RNA helicase DHX29
MAGARKKKSKPVANPARGFATTSVASKPRVDISEPVEEPSLNGTTTSDPTAAGPAKSDVSIAPLTAQPIDATLHTQPETSLSPEEFERQLEESELQLLVEKHAQKVRRDAARQKTRLETDRRLLRGQAESLNTRKWLPQELMDQILDLIQAESRFAASSLASERPLSEKMPSEEDLTMRLWTLQQTLAGLSFPAEKIDAVLQYVLDLAPSVASTNRDYIWGLDEALDWLAKACNREELREYDYKGVKPAKSQPGMSISIPTCQ